MSMQVEFLTEKDRIVAEWPQLEPLFEKVVSKAVHGEYTAEDLYALALSGQAHIGFVREDDEIIMALAFEFRPYPKKLAINFLAMGGRKLDEVMSRFLETFRKWAIHAGADWIEASCSPAMARIHARNNFVTTYQLVRLDLEKKGETT